MRISNQDMLRETDLPFDKAPPYRIKAVEYTIPTTRQKRNYAAVWLFRAVITR